MLESNSSNSISHLAYKSKWNQPHGIANMTKVSSTFRAVTDDEAWKFTNRNGIAQRINMQNIW